MATQKRVIRRSVILKGFILVILVAVIYAGWKVFSMASGYGAKNLCSCVFVANREVENVKKNELDFFPVNWASFQVDRKDSSVTATVWGMAKQTAIYRSGYGCTLLNDITEQELRSQPQDFAVKKVQDTASAMIWPYGDQLQESISGNPNIEAALDRAFAEKNVDEPVRTRAIVVLHKGRIIAERYGNGFSSSSKLMGWSMTKSVTSALVGIAVKKGLLDIHQPAPVEAFKQASDARRKITIRHLLQQTSGLDFAEIYSRPSEVTQMLFREGNMASYVESLHSKQTPGSNQYYSSGNTNILMSVLRDVLPAGQYHRFPYAELFNKLGMQSAIIETDASGAFVGSSYMYATARDWARFGLLYLQDGRWAGEQILPEGWVRESVTPAMANSAIQYGYQWWLNTANADGVRRYPSLPDSMYYADGYENQFIFILPEQDLVIVRLGLTKGPYFNEEQLVKEVMAAINQ